MNMDFEKRILAGGRAILYRGDSLELLAAGLLADLVLTRVPVLLGEGVPLFGPLPAPVPAQLESVRQLPAGAVQSTYRFGAA